MRVRLATALLVARSLAATCHKEPARRIALCGHKRARLLEFTPGTGLAAERSLDAVLAVQGQVQVPPNPDLSSPQERSGRTHARVSGPPVAAMGKAANKTEAELALEKKYELLRKKRVRCQCPLRPSAPSAPYALVILSMPCRPIRPSAAAPAR